MFEMNIESFDTTIDGKLMLLFNDGNGSRCVFPIPLTEDDDADDFRNVSTPFFKAVKEVSDFRAVAGIDKETNAFEILFASYDDEVFERYKDDHNLFMAKVVRDMFLGKHNDLYECVADELEIGEMDILPPMTEQMELNF